MEKFFGKLSPHSLMVMTTQLLLNKSVVIFYIPKGQSSSLWNPEEKKELAAIILCQQYSTSGVRKRPSYFKCSHFPHVITIRSRRELVSRFVHEIILFNSTTLGTTMWER